MDKLSAGQPCDKEIHCPIHQETHRVFNESITHHLGPNATEQNFLAEDLTPDYNIDDDDYDLDPDHNNLEVTQRWGTTTSAQRFLSLVGELW
jgi:hypothetical protein